MVKNLSFALRDVVRLVCIKILQKQVLPCWSDDESYVTVYRTAVELNSVGKRSAGRLKIWWMNQVKKGVKDKYKTSRDVTDLKLWEDI